MAGLRMRRIVMTGAAALVLVAGGTAAGAAVASSPVDSSGVIHGCWTNAAINGTHVFVLQDAGTTCPKGTTAISWNQTGPQGPAGPAGPAGTVGATGPAGPAGPIGNTGPAGPVGAPGPTGPAGPAGPIGNTGPPGPAGANGNTVLNGTGAPPSSVGNDGDFYIDTAADVLYGPKANGSWPAAGVSLVGSPGTTGPQGPQGPAGPQGAQGPPGTAGGLDAMAGTVCNLGSPDQGALNVSYSAQGAATITCVPTTLETLTVNINGGDGTDTITSDPAGIDCNPSSATSVCTASFPLNTIVTLSHSLVTGLEEMDVVTSWSGPGTGATGCDQSGGLVGPQPNDPTCTVTMSGAVTANANIDGIVTVDNSLSDPSSGGVFEVNVLVNGLEKLSDQAVGEESVVVPYGATVEAHAIDSGTVNFSGADCTGSGATIGPAPSPQIGEICTFTMSPGDSSAAPGFPTIIATG
jgi:hypothetical protein